MGKIICLHGPPGSRIPELLELFRTDQRFNISYTHTYKSFSEEDLHKKKYSPYGYYNLARNFPQKVSKEFFMLGMLAGQGKNLAVSFPTFFHETRKIWNSRNEAKVIIIHLTAEFPYLLAHDINKEYVKILSEGSYPYPIPVLTNPKGKSTEIYYDHKLDITNKSLEEIGNAVYELSFNNL